MFRTVVAALLLAMAKSTIYISAKSSNDIVSLLAQTTNAKRVDNADAAVAAAGSGDAVLLLAENNPDQRTAFPANLQRMAESKGFRAYVEFPEDLAPSHALSWKQRCVVTTTELAAHGLNKMSILQLQDPVAVDWCGAARCANPICAKACNSSLVSFAQVAGVNRAVFGVSNAERIPLLFRNSSRVLVAAAKLSNVATGRSAPQEAFRALWNSILEQLLPPGTDERPVLPAWTPSVGPAYGEFEELPGDAISAAVASSAAWLSTGSTLMTVADRDPNAIFGCCAQLSGNQECTPRQCNWSQVCPAPHAPPDVTNISCIQEGWSSIIHSDGAQHMMPLFIRTDGNAEVAMGLATAAALLPAAAVPMASLKAWRGEAAQLLDYMFRWSTDQTFVGSNASNPAHGIVWWNQQDAEACMKGL